MSDVPCPVWITTGVGSSGEVQARCRLCGERLSYEYVLTPAGHAELQWVDWANARACDPWHPTAVPAHECFGVAVWKAAEAAHVHER